MIRIFHESRCTPSVTVLFRNVYHGKHCIKFILLFYIFVFALDSDCLKPIEDYDIYNN